MTKKNDNTKTLNPELARLAIADLHFSLDFMESYSDIYKNHCYNHSPIYLNSLATILEQITSSYSEILDFLYDKYPVEMSGYCSDKPQRALTKKETNRLNKILLSKTA